LNDLLEIGDYSILDTSFFYFKHHRCAAILSSALLVAAKERLLIQGFVSPVLNVPAFPIGCAYRSSLKKLIVIRNTTDYHWTNSKGIKKNAESTGYNEP
jgi:hypothetical protein